MTTSIAGYRQNRARRVRSLNNILGGSPVGNNTQESSPLGSARTAHNKTESSPKIDTSAYIFDRVKHIEVKQEIPEHLSNLAKSESWAQMARSQAFEQMFQKLGTQRNFKVECVIREKEETDEVGRNRHYIVCHLQYTTG